MAMSAISSERETIRCGSCKLVQFVGAANACKRCHKVLREAPKAIPGPALVVAPIEPAQTCSAIVARKVLRARKRAKMTSRQLAKAMGTTRQYISKIENAHLVPILSTFERLSEALGCPVGDLMPSAPAYEPDALDDFMAEVIGYMGQLSSQSLAEIEATAAYMAKVERSKQPKKERVRDPRLLIM